MDLLATTAICKVDETLGLVFGYAMVCNEEGNPYFDLQGHHIPEDTMLRTLTKFMSADGIAGDMHRKDEEGNLIPEGRIVFAFPMTQEIAKSLGIEVKRTGAIIAMKPDNPDILAKYASGERTGFSIGGVKPVFEEVA